MKILIVLFVMCIAAPSFARPWTPPVPPAPSTATADADAKAIAESSPSVQSEARYDFQYSSEAASAVPAYSSFCVRVLAGQTTAFGFSLSETQQFCKDFVMFETARDSCADTPRIKVATPQLSATRPPRKWRRVTSPKLMLCATTLPSIGNTSSGTARSCAARGVGKTSAVSSPPQSLLCCSANVVHNNFGSSAT